MKEDAFFEDVNSILNNGEVPNLFPSDEYMQIIDAVARETPTPAYSPSSSRGRSCPPAFPPASADGGGVPRCRRNIHIVLSLSPIGDAFRERLRQFPALVNCCTIDWFHRWPDEALRSVASRYDTTSSSLLSIVVTTNRFVVHVEFDESTPKSVLDTAVSMQKTVIELSASYAAELRRRSYVTPTSYLSLLKTFVKVSPSSSYNASCHC